MQKRVVVSHEGTYYAGQAGATVQESTV